MLYFSGPLSFYFRQKFRGEGGLGCHGIRLDHVDRFQLLDQNLPEIRVHPADLIFPELVRRVFSDGHQAITGILLSKVTQLLKFLGSECQHIFCHLRICVGKLLIG